ncbi:MAG: tRNA (adenine(22)-N(1))-methyltransferase TrmK [Clostridia bacterium]|nr:tRNA (adenine(22)-N(1))-methyltransferase TrmK [Clostridia bacterium]
MGYGKRIDTLCSLLVKAETFADVGCDHGYCSEYMLKNDLCERAILSDISKGSLAKAETLLAPYIRQGRATSVLGDGFLGVPKDVDEVLIAGMGGSEIVSILSDEKYGFMPKRFDFSRCTTRKNYVDISLKTVDISIGILRSKMGNFTT